MEPSPVVGLTARTLFVKAAGRDRPVETVARSFVETLGACGARPILLPNPEDAAVAPGYLDLVDGLLLTGGDDPHPRLFGEEPHPAIERVDVRRDAFEVALVREARDRGVPVLGVCRGIQLMNIALGGDIYQDIPAQTDSTVCHSQQTIGDSGWHDVAVEPGSALARWLGESAAVNSFHHQACRRLGEGLVATARTSDGLIEAIEAPDHPFFVGVQWHPEIGSGGRGLLEAFVAAARDHAAASSKSRRTAVSSR